MLDDVMNGEGSSSDTNETLVDPGRIDELVADIGADALPEIMELFIAEVENAMAPLVSRKRWPAGEIGETAHYIKGCALNLGFTALAREAGRIEKLSHSAPEAPIDPAKLKSVFEQSSRHLERIVETLYGGG